jgi:hypothetical protein
MMQPATESTNQPNRSDSSAVKQKTPSDSRRPWHVEGARPSRPTARSRVRRVAGGYVDPHSRSGGFRGGESSIEQRPGLLGHDCIAPNTTSSVVSPLATRFHRPLRAPGARRSRPPRPAPASLRAALGSGTVVESDADARVCGLSRLPMPRGCDRQRAPKVPQELARSMPERRLPIPGTATGAHDEQITVPAVRESA